MKKVIKIIGIILLELIVIVACVWVGGQMNSSAEEKAPLTINKIALVNLDDGVEVNEQYRYYGTEFISELDDNFEITSLEQARRGLDNNLYAAYIIIPAMFSKNVESINSGLTKSNITYKINSNLDYVIREEVITDIWVFNNSLSTNIEYVYVDAILKGVHTVQDGADELLANDLKDLQAVLQFTETDLIVDPEYPDEKHVDNDIKNLDVSDIFASMQTVFSDLSTEYKASQTSAQQEYDKLIEEMATVSTKMEELNTEIGDVANIDEGEEFNIENDEQIDSYINGYNTNLVQWKKNYEQQATYNFDGYMDKCQLHTNKQLEDLNSVHKDYLKTYYKTAFTECDTTVIKEINSENQAEFNNYAKTLRIYDVIQMIIHIFKEEIGRLNEEINMLNKEIEDLHKTITDMSRAIDDLGGKYIVNNKEIKGTVTKQEFLDKTYDTEVFVALMEDVPNIKEIGQKERNVALRNSITTWLKEDLVHYGIDAEDIGELDATEMDGETAVDLIDDWYETKIDLSIEPVEEKDSTEEEDTTEDNSTEETTESDASETTKDASDNEENAPKEDDGSEESDENEKTEYEIKLEKRAKVLFANTYEPSLVDAETLDNLISGVVLSPISSSIMQKYSELNTSYTALNTVWTNWNTKLDAFTIDSYGNDEKRNVIEKTFNGNLQKIQTAVNEKSTEYETYVTQANEANSSNLEAWETSIQNANKATRNNIDNSIKNIKTTREQMNTNNNNLMTNISNVLPYSRIGELENRNVYSYITSPIIQEDLSENKLVNNVEEDRQLQHAENDNRREMIILAFGIILCMTGGGVLIKQMKRRNKYLQKQNL